MNEPIICPGCGLKRPDLPVEHPDFATAWAAYAKCCNPACNARWGTGCWHCHDPSFVSDPERPERAVKLAVKIWVQNCGLWFGVEGALASALTFDHRMVVLAAVDDGCWIKAPASDAMGYQIKPDPVRMVAWPAALLWALGYKHELSIGQCTSCGLDELNHFGGKWAQRIREDLRASPGEWVSWARARGLHHDARRAMQREANKLVRCGMLKRQRSELRPNTYEFRLACCDGHGLDKRSVGELLLDLATNGKLIPRAAEAVTAFADDQLQRGDPLGLGLLTWLRERELGAKLDPSWQAACIWALVRDLLPHGLTCPTCSSTPPQPEKREPLPGKCCSCFSAIPLEEQELHPDPYAEDINGDSSLHLQCESCREESASDI